MRKLTTYSNRYSIQHWLNSYVHAWDQLLHGLTREFSHPFTQDTPASQHPTAARTRPRPGQILRPLPNSRPYPNPRPRLKPERKPPLTISPLFPRRDWPDRYGVREREVVLTFDDGPNLDQTPKILDILARHNIKAVFFVVGYLLTVDDYYAIAKRTVEEGHIIGNHSYTHADLTTLSDASIRWELNRTQELIGELGHEMRPFRPPYGRVSQRVLDIAAAEGYNTVMWTVDTRDWALRDDGAWIQSTLQEMMPMEHSLLVLHDSKESTADSLERFITTLEATRNTRFVSLFEEDEEEGAEELAEENLIENESDEDQTMAVDDGVKIVQ
ncbi:MAG: polysaccharide deacetylase family protein [Chloroflexota bacterium]